MSQDKETDEKLSKVIESLNLHKLLPEIYNVSSAELRNNSLLLGDRVIVGRFAPKENNNGEAPVEPVDPMETNQVGAEATGATASSEVSKMDNDVAEVRSCFCASLETSATIFLYAIVFIRHFSIYHETHTRSAACVVYAGRVPRLLVLENG